MPPKRPMARVMIDGDAPTSQPKRNVIETEAKLPKLKVSIVSRLSGKVARSPSDAAQGTEQERLAQEARSGCPTARIPGPASCRSRGSASLTAANMVLAAANMAPKVRSTAISVPAALRNMLIRDLVLEVGLLRLRLELELGVVVDRLLELLVVRQAGRADLHAGDRAVAPGVLLDVLEVGPDLALGRAAAGGEDADDAVLLLVAEVEQPADLRPLVAREMFLLTMHSPRPRRSLCPADDLEIGPELARGGLDAADDDVVPRPVAAARRWRC